MIRAELRPTVDSKRGRPSETPAQATTLKVRLPQAMASALCVCWVEVDMWH
jgi:hypothetical protein